MALRIGTASQKGGVYKSAIARALATTYASAGWTVKICDLDIDQSTCHDWNLRRMKAGIEPIIRVETFGTFNQALKASSSDDVDLLIFDGGPQATAGTVDMGKSVDLMILPTGLSLDDLTPTVRLANKLVDKHGISLTESLWHWFVEATVTKKLWRLARISLQHHIIYSLARCMKRCCIAVPMTLDFP